MDGLLLEHNRLDIVGLRPAVQETENNGGMKENVRRKAYFSVGWNVLSVVRMVRQSRCDREGREWQTCGAMPSM
jgi:hypothetical protein